MVKTAGKYIVLVFIAMIAWNCQKESTELVFTETIEGKEEINSKFYGSVYNEFADTLPRKLILFYIRQTVLYNWDCSGDCIEGYVIDSTVVIDSITIAPNTLYYELKFDLNHPRIDRSVSYYKTFDVKSYPDSVYDYQYDVDGYRSTLSGHGIKSFGSTGTEVDIEW